MGNRGVHVGHNTHVILFVQGKKSQGMGGGKGKCQGDPLHSII